MKLLENKQRLLPVILIFLVILTGCDSKYNSDMNNNDAPINDNVMEKIRVWSDNAHEKELRLRQIEAFNSTKGKELGIEIEYTVYGSNYQDVIKTAAQSGDAPELFRPTTTFMKEFVDSDYMIPITDLPGGEEMVSEYKDDLVIDQHIFDGEVYTLPYNLTTYKLIVNNELFNKAGILEYPKTWKEVRQAARQITKSSDGRAFGWVLGLQSDWMISTYLIRPNGANVGHVGFNHEKMKFEFEEFAPVIDAVQGMISDGSVFPGYEGLDADAARAQFAEGRIGMIPAASFDINVYNDQFTANFDWSVIPVPAFDDGGSSYKEFADVTSLLGVGTAAKDKKEKTMEVFKFFYSDENAAQMYENSLYIPYSQDAIDMATSKPRKKGFEDFAQTSNTVFFLPMPDMQLSLEGNTYRKTINYIFADVYEGQDTKTVLRNLDKQYNTALEKLPADVLKEYEHPQEIMDNFRK